MSDRRHDERVEALREIRNACFEFDTSGDFIISMKEMVQGNAPAGSLTSRIGSPAHFFRRWTLETEY